MKYINNYNTFMNEEFINNIQDINKEEIIIFLKNLKKIHPYLSLDYKVLENNNILYILIGKIKIKSSQHNKGYGTIVMNEILNFSKNNNIPVTLTPDEIYGSDIDRLINFYERLGFIKNDNSEYYGEYIFNKIINT